MRRVRCRCDNRKQTEQKWDKKLAEVAETREELQRQINELRQAADPLRSSITQTNTTLVRQKSEVYIYNNNF